MIDLSGSRMGQFESYTPSREEMNAAQKFQADLQQIAESFIGQASNYTAEVFMKARIYQIVSELYAAGGALADSFGRIDNIVDVQIVVDRGDYAMNVSAIRRDVRTTISERQANFADGKITREHFLEATGREPQHDDLERANCDKIGQLGHFMCGWNHRQNRPAWE